MTRSDLTFSKGLVAVWTVNGGGVERERVGNKDLNREGLEATSR